MAPSQAFESRVDALYGAPLEAFVAERKRLAGELKREGAPGEAAAFLALGKPTLSAWLTNQTVRRVPELVRALVEATDAIAAAQRGALGGAGGGSPQPMQAAVAEQRRLVAQLGATARAAAAELLAGRGEDAADRVENNFRWGAVAGPDREALVRGRLVRDLSAPGFGGFGDLATAAPPAHGPSSAEAPSATSDAPGGRERQAPRLEIVKGGRGDSAAHGHRESEAAARERARAAAEADREHRRRVAEHAAELRRLESEIARARRDLSNLEADEREADERIDAAEAELASARRAREDIGGRRRALAASLTSLESAEDSLRRRGPTAPPAPTGPFR